MARQYRNEYARRRGEGWTTWALGMALLIAVSVMAYYVYVNNLDYTALIPPAQRTTRTLPTPAPQRTTGRSSAPAQPAGPSTEQQAVQQAAPIVPSAAEVIPPKAATAPDLGPGNVRDESGQVWHETVGAPQMVYPTPQPAPEATLSQAELDASAASAEQNLIDSALSGLTPEEQAAAIVAAENQAWNNAPVHTGP